MPDHQVQIQLDLNVPMRDGVLLSADLYRPVGEGRWPAALCRTIYDSQQQRYVDWAYRFAQNGYAALIQDCRGRYDSDGVWDPYVCETADGYDTQQWLGQQPWCDGQIGTFGVSYLGFTQVLPAPLRSPYARALVPIANQQDNYGHLYCDGVLQLQNAIHFARIGNRTMRSTSYPLLDLDSIYRRLPLISALDDVADCPAYRLFVSHSTFDEYWKSYSLRDKYGEVDVPAYFITGWYDNLVHEGFKLFAGWKSQARSAETRATTKLLVGPWTHSLLGSAAPFGDLDFGPVAQVDIPGEHLRWYDRRLRGLDTGIDRQGALRIFVMGENVWRDEAEWPLARTRFTPYYLRGQGRANSRFGDGELSRTPPGDEPPDRFTDDPDNPVPTQGGQSMFIDNTGPRDRRAIERRDDVLVYSTPPLEREVEVTGPIEVTLYAASSAVDTDFTATLVDVHPNGLAIILSEGIVRARFRDSLERPTPIEPGRVYPYRIAIWETSNLFKAGHRIRLEIASSNFPRFDRNLNTGGDPATDTEWRIAEQTVFHRSEYPSQVTLPVIPR
ncbi:MAG: CocE/NonD family hydrolase [Chloroflexota bacterium]